MGEAAWNPALGPEASSAKETAPSAQIIKELITICCQGNYSFKKVKPRNCSVKNDVILNPPATGHQVAKQSQNPISMVSLAGDFIKSSGMGTRSTSPGACGPAGAAVFVTTPGKDRRPFVEDLSRLPCQVSLLALLSRLPPRGAWRRACQHFQGLGKSGSIADGSSGRTDPEGWAAPGFSVTDNQSLEESLPVLGCSHTVPLMRNGALGGHPVQGPCERAKPPACPRMLGTQPQEPAAVCRTTVQSNPAKP